MPSGYQVTRLPVTFVVHKVHTTIKIMVTKWLPLYSLSYCVKYYEKCLAVIKLPGYQLHL